MDSESDVAPSSSFPRAATTPTPGPGGGRAVPPVLIVPSVLPADFARLGEECQRLVAAGVDRIQFDVMDGRFVPNLTFGPDVIASVRDEVTVPFEAHLMIEEPDALLPRFVEAGCELIIVHAETCVHLHRTLSAIHDLGAEAAVALNPHTPLEVVTNVVDLLDMLLVMTVNPGFGGQAYIATMEPKVAMARALLDTADHWIDLEVDGGISAGTVTGAAEAGANVLVAGSALFNHRSGLTAAVTELRKLATEAWTERI
ncbi:MAG: ribulose-phosphate 3-epimerase [Acidimicrobiales bacterium]